MTPRTIATDLRGPSVNHGSACGSSSPEEILELCAARISAVCAVFGGYPGAGGLVSVRGSRALRHGHGGFSERAIVCRLGAMDEVPFTLSVDGQGKVILSRQGQEDARDVRIRRAFPWSDPDRYISIRSSEGKELELIENLAELRAEQRQLIREQLGKWAFVPVITRIIGIDMRFGFQQWKVETDRGPVEFRVQEREDIRFLGDGRFSVKDVDGCVYELPSLSQLDERSRLAVEQVL